MVNTVIIGAGDMAYGLCHLFKNHNYNTEENHLCITKPGLQSRFLKNNPTFHDTGVSVVNMDDAVLSADIIILAIPSYALKSFLNDHYKKLKNKILVDVTNSSVPGEDLHGMLGFTETSFVKAFNDNGAVDLLLHRPYGKKSMTTVMCGKNLQAVGVVKKFAEEALGFDVKIVPQARYQAIATHQNSIGEDWAHAAYVMILLFVLTELYALIRYNVWKGYDWFHLPLQVTNKAICWSALNGFALSMSPGLMARFFDFMYGDKMKDKPSWIRWGLSIRKPLGLLSLWFLGIHIIMSLLIFNQKYYGKFFIDKDANASKLNKIGEFSFFFGIVGAALYFILGICSLPSVGSQMTSRSWQLVYGPVAWIALLFGTTHVLAMGVLGWKAQETWPGNLPPITLVSVLIPMLVIFLKIVQLWSAMANKIQLGEKDYGENDSAASNSYDVSVESKEEEEVDMEADMEEPTTALVLRHGRSPPNSSPFPVKKKGKKTKSHSEERFDPRVLVETEMDGIYND